MNATLRPLALASLAALALVGCRKKPVYGPSESQVKAERIGKARSDIISIATPRGCSKASECKVVGIGYNRCGGSRQHIVYCSHGVDESTLRARTDELLKLEEDEASHQGEPPPCKKVPEPSVELVDGACRAKL